MPIERETQLENSTENVSYIFVTGASRSGTTMMNRILGSHSQVLGSRELHYFGDTCKLDQLNVSQSEEQLLLMAAQLTARFERGLWKSSVRESDREMAAQIVGQVPSDKRTGAELFNVMMTHYAGQSSKKFICEQTPRNIFYIKELLKNFPDAKFVHMIRDPRAVMASQKNRWRQRAMGRKVIPMTEVIRVKVNYHPWTISKLWLKATSVAAKMVDHPNLKLVKFEDVISEPEQEVKQICEFLGIEFEPDMLNIPQMGSSHIVNEAGAGISQDVVSKWSDTLDNGEIAACEKLTSSMMSRFGYARQIDGNAKNTGYLLQLLLYPVHIVGMMLANPRRAWIQLTALLGVRS